MLRNYVEALGENITDLAIEKIKSDKVVAVYDDNSIPDKAWSIRKGLVGSTTFDGGLYAINEGEWYRLDENFKISIESSFEYLIEDWPQPPTPMCKHFDHHGNGGYQSEASYNAEVANREGYLLLDRRLFQTPEARGSDFEICDLLDLQNKRFIHVKKSSRKSSVLSHFFKQGGNSAQQLKRFPSIWNDLLLFVRNDFGEPAARRLADLIEDRDRNWGIEFRIADTPRVNGQFNIPFFSKISLRDEVRNLNAMSFDVSLRFIRLEPEAI